MRVVALDVGADAVAVGSDAQQLAPGRGVPVPRQLQLSEGAVVGLEFRIERIGRGAGHGGGVPVGHETALPARPIARDRPRLPAAQSEEKLKLPIPSIWFSEYMAAAMLGA